MRISYDIFTQECIYLQCSYIALCNNCWMFIRSSNCCCCCYCCLIVSIQGEAVHLIEQGKAPRMIQWDGGATYEKIWKKKEVAEVHIKVTSMRISLAMIAPPPTYALCGLFSGTGRCTPPPSPIHPPPPPPPPILIYSTQEKQTAMVD